MTLEEMTVQRVALLGVRFRGVGHCGDGWPPRDLWDRRRDGGGHFGPRTLIAAAQDGGRRRQNTIRGSAVIIGRSRRGWISVT
jgi:hypothetical protein